MTDPALWTVAEKTAFEARRRTRNKALGILLAALTVLFFGITMVRMVPPSGEVQARLQAEKPGWAGR
jgi:hypothetical protein